MSAFEIVAVLAYLLAVGYLGFLGWRQTRSASDYLVAGRKAHPVVMALSYGSTFISTSAIVGFGGVAATFGMSLLWLVFLNIFVGIFIAFVFIGGRTRRIGHRLDAHTFPELLGRRYESRFLQVFAGLVIFVFMPLYAAAVLMGGAEFIREHYNVDYNVALLVFSVLVAAYVIAGGLKGVMYTDALQGAIMIVGMAVLLIWTYSKVGGVSEGHQGLAAMKDQAFLGFKAIGFEGWTAFPKFGWGARSYELWWTVVTGIMLGVGIGVLAQPQLVVRFMTVKSQRELNRAVLLGGIFILMLPGVAYTVGALTNLYFYRTEVVTGYLVGTTERADVIAKKDRLAAAVTVPCRLLHIDTTGDGRADVHLVAQGLVGAEPAKDPLARNMPTASVTELPDGRVEVRPNATSFTRAVVRLEGNWRFHTDSIIPIFVSSAMPRWFGVLFLLTLLAAAMSTLSGQFHGIGSAIARDVIEQVAPIRNRTVHIVRLGIIVGVIAAVLLAYYARGFPYVIARATAIFFGLCAAAFLPALIGGLFTRRATRAGAIASVVAGFAFTALWLLFIKDQEAQAIGLCHALTGKTSLLIGQGNWPVVDPLVLALPLSTVVLIAVSAFTRKPSAALMEVVFGRDEAAQARPTGNRGVPVGQPRA